MIEITDEEIRYLLTISLFRGLVYENATRTDVDPYELAKYAKDYYENVVIPL